MRALFWAVSKLKIMDEIIKKLEEVAGELDYFYQEAVVITEAEAARIIILSEQIQDTMANYAEYEILFKISLIRK